MIMLNSITTVDYVCQQYTGICSKWISVTRFENNTFGNSVFFKPKYHLPAL